jgi:V/A-type H+-transporting ATPase subunit I
MVRIELVGRQERLPAALAFLQAHAAVELRTPAVPRPRESGTGVEPDGAGEARLQAALERLDALLARLPPAVAGRSAPLPEVGSEAFAARLAGLESEAGALETRRAALEQERRATTQFARLVVALAPLGHDLDPSCELELHGLVLRGDPAALALLEGEVRRITAGTFELKARPLDHQTTGVLLVVPRAHGKAVTALLFERGVPELPLPSEYTGKRLVDVLLLLAARQRALPGELAGLQASLEALAATWRGPLEEARRTAGWAIERRRAAARCGGTHFAFVVCGYMPAERLPALRAAAEAELGPEVAVLARPPHPPEWGDVPVVLRNRALVRPFQRLLGLVSLPRYGSVDPTPWMALFFPLFFGLVLGDVAFGLVGLAVGLLALRLRWGGEVGGDVARVALWCSASAIVFGLLFGEALGELGTHLGLHPLLLDRRRAFLSLLGLACAAGGLHLGVGMWLGCASALRAGRLREAAARASKLLLLVALAVAAGALAGLLQRAALLPALVVGAGLAAAALLAEGPLAVLDVVLALGNVLSYARLMALGLASVMLAEVANRVAQTLQPAVAGLALGILLHAVNFTLGLISPTVAALRLQYVEFFDKFYDEGGFPFRPFGLPPGTPPR